MREKVKLIGFVRTDKAGLGPVHYYRVALPLSALKKKSSFFDVTLITDKEFTTRLNLFGVASTHSLLLNKVWIISRLYHDVGLDNFVNTVKGSGAALVFDTDDDLTDDFRALGRGDVFKETVSRFDQITVSTPFLGQRMALYNGKRPIVLPNCLDYTWFSDISRATARVAEGFTIGLMGTASHYDDWIYPVKAMRKIAEEHPEVTLLVAGFQPEYLDDLPNLQKIDFVPYARYPGVVRQFDVVCCALDPDDDFNKSKSAIKALEAWGAIRPVGNTIGGAVPVCTDMKVYRRAVNHMSTGMLVDNDQWYDALKELVTNQALWRKMSVAGNRWVKRNRDMATQWPLWEKAYKDVYRRTR